MAFEADEIKSIILSNPYKIFSFLHQKRIDVNHVLDDFADLLFNDAENALLWPKLLRAPQAEIQRLLIQVVNHVVQQATNFGYDQIVAVIKLIQAEQNASDLVSLLLGYHNIITYAKEVDKMETSFIGQAIIEGPNSLIFQQLIPKYWARIPAKYQLLLWHLYPDIQEILIKHEQETKRLEQETRGLELIEKIIEKDDNGLNQHFNLYEAEIIASLKSGTLLPKMLQVIASHDDGVRLLDFLQEIYPEFLQRSEFLVFINQVLTSADPALKYAIWILKQNIKIGAKHQQQIVQCIQNWLVTKEILTFINKIRSEKGIDSLYKIFERISEDEHADLSLEDFFYMLHYQPTQTELVRVWLNATKNQDPVNLQKGIALLKIFHAENPNILKGPSFIDLVLQSKDAKIIKALLQEHEFNDALQQHKAALLLALKTIKKPSSNAEEIRLQVPVRAMEHASTPHLAVQLPALSVRGLEQDSREDELHFASVDATLNRDSALAREDELHFVPVDATLNINRDSALTNSVDRVKSQDNTPVLDLINKKNKPRVQFSGENAEKEFFKIQAPQSISTLETMEQEISQFWDRHRNARDWEQLWVKLFSQKLQERDCRLMQAISLDSILDPEKINAHISVVSSRQAICHFIYPLLKDGACYGLLLLCFNLNKQLEGGVYFQASSKLTPNVNRLLSKLEVLPPGMIAVCCMQQAEGSHSFAYTTAALAALADTPNSVAVPAAEVPEAIAEFDSRETSPQKMDGAKSGTVASAEIVQCSSFLDIFTMIKEIQARSLQIQEQQQQQQQHKIELLHNVAKQTWPEQLQRAHQNFLVSLPQLKWISASKAEVLELESENRALIQKKFPNIAERTLTPEELECIYMTLIETLGGQSYMSNIRQTAFSIWDSKINLVDSVQKSLLQQDYPLIFACIEGILEEFNLPVDSIISNLSVVDQHKLATEFIRKNIEVFSSAYNKIRVGAQNLRQVLEDRLALSPPSLSAQVDSKASTLATPFAAQLVAQAGVAQEMAAESNTSLKSILKFK